MQHRQFLAENVVRSLMASLSWQRLEVLATEHSPAPSPYPACCTERCRDPKRDLLPVGQSLVAPVEIVRIHD
jgi:hypothetical protein